MERIFIEKQGAESSCIGLDQEFAFEAVPLALWLWLDRDLAKVAANWLMWMAIFAGTKRMGSRLVRRENVFATCQEKHGGM